MSIQIKTINLTTKSPNYNRDVILNGSHIQSVNIYQTDGSFITTYPFDDKLIWYPQSPNNASNTLMGQVKIYEEFSGYGNLSFPMDARFDFIRRWLWIADSGNKRVLKIDINKDTVGKSISNNYFSHSLAININNGDVFVKSIKDSQNGIIQQYDSKGIIKNDFQFECNYNVGFEDMENTYAFIISNPLPSSMAFDHVRSRLWWTGDNFVYMADMLNQNIVAYDVSVNSFETVGGIDIDFASGNAFTVARNFVRNQWYVLQMFKDNNSIVSSSYVALMEN